MKSVITDKWILCPECKAKTRTQVLEDTEVKNFPLFCPKCKKNFIINVKENVTLRVVHVTERFLSFCLLCDTF